MLSGKPKASRLARFTPRVWLLSALQAAWKATSAIDGLARQGWGCPRGRGRVLPVCTSHARGACGLGGCCQSCSRGVVGPEASSISCFFLER